MVKSYLFKSAPVWQRQNSLRFAVKDHIDDDDGNNNIIVLYVHEALDHVQTISVSPLKASTVPTSFRATQLFDFASQLVCEHVLLLFA